MSEWPDLQCLLTRTTHQLACPRCLNNPRGVTTAHGRDELECEHCGRTRNPEDDGWCWYCLSGDTSEPLGTPEDTQP